MSKLIVLFLVILMATSVFVGPDKALADSFWTRFQSSSVTIDEDGPHPAPSAAIDWCGHWDGLSGECANMGCFSSGVTRWKAHADKTWVDLWQSADASGGDTGSCHQGGPLLARSTFDVTFECEAGVPTPINASLNFEVDGYATFASPGVANYAMLTVQAGLPGSSGIAGTWVAASSQNNPGSTDGVFTGINSDALSGSFTGPIFSPALNVPVSIQIGGILVLNSHMPNHDPVTGDFWDEAAQGGQGINLPVGSLVFELPEGCTCNSEAVGIIDNLIDDVVQVESESWGGVKSIFR